MIIALRGGHNYQATGAKNIIDEVTEDRKVYKSVKKHLEQLGHTVLDVTPHKLPKDDDLPFGVNIANKNKADLFVSIHFNNAYDDVQNKPIGSEVLVYKDEYKFAVDVVNNLGKLGFKNRGIKVRPELYELRKTNMSACIVEVCFVESSVDVDLYKKLGVDIIGEAIACGLVGKTFKTQETDKKEEANKDNINVSINGNIKSVQAVNIAGNNYVRLRDLECDKIKIGFDKVLKIPTVNTL